MGSKWKYLVFIVLINANLVAQKADSANLVLKRFFIGTEIGKSPTLSFKNDPDYDYTNINIKPRPYYSITFGYNFKLSKKGFITPKIGFAAEYFDYNFRNGGVKYFDYTLVTGTATNNVQGMTTETLIRTYKENHYFATVELNYQKYFSPFKNKNINYFLAGGILLRFRFHSGGEYTSSYSKDSLSTIREQSSSSYTTTSTNLKTQNEDYFKNSSTLFPFPPDIALSTGLLFEGKHLQHKVGTVLNIRLDPNYESSKYTSFFIFRLFYSINI